jgi:23S rRNA (guanosine2251-2'-O)-methyltransferase
VAVYLCGMLKKPMEALERLSVEEFKRSEKTPVRVVLDNVRSMHNVGSVFRTADAFRIEGIDLCGYTPRPPHRDIHKTALGATETVEWREWDDAAEAVAALAAQGYEVWAVEQAEGSVWLQDLKTQSSKRLAVVFGNEVEGVRQDVVGRCHGCIEIPQLGMKHSLNISVAAGVVLWELCRDRFPKHR